MRTLGSELVVLNAKATTGIGTPILVEDADKILISFGTASSANLTIKFQGSVSDTMPTFSSAQSVSNHWDYIEVVDLEDGAAIDGDTGISCAGTDDFRLFSANVDGLKWFCIEVTARSAGSVTAKVKQFVNA